mmetsp:Transcript_62203/g.131454  ORF Transcript_62203/g.131454 Transcript_62203/m.131454 type:complete len:612 (+) Transcript_62203:204-2039(+)
MDTVASDLAHAIVLAGVRHEETLQTYEQGPKRKSRWSECKVAKKGKRWGQPDDKPYKPLCYVDLPMGLTEKEIDQFLREQRLEDLHRKIQAHELEDFAPDIRPPSPPPVYDKAGNRLNTRDIRIRKAMTAEYNRLIRYMIKNVEGYLPPVDWKPSKLLKKIIIPIEKFPQAPFMGVIIGPSGVNHKKLQDTTGCKIFIRGRDIGDKWQSEEEAAMPQHVHVEGETEEQILAAERLIEPLLNPESPEFEYARLHGMQYWAQIRGFSMNKAEQRCSICGALGHLGFECPETNNERYNKLANVTCTICGDKGHVASDCKKAMEANKRENVDWKEQAEKKAQMEQSFNDMMGDLGNLGGAASGSGAAAAPSTLVPAGAPPVGAAVPPPGAAGSGVDKSVICPAHLVGKLIGPAGATIKKLAADTGAQINMDQVQHASGGKAVVITAADPAVRERAKAAVSEWIKNNSTGGMIGAPPPVAPRAVLPGQPNLRPPVQPLNRPPAVGSYSMPARPPTVRPPVGVAPPLLRPPPGYAPPAGAAPAGVRPGTYGAAPPASAGAPGGYGQPGQPGAPTYVQPPPGVGQQYPPNLPKPGLVHPPQGLNQYGGGCGYPPPKTG